MATTYTIQETTLTSIADAIRSKTGSTDKIKVSDMPDSINNIQGEESIENFPSMEGSKF